MLSPDPTHPLSHDNQEIHDRLLNLPPTHEIKDQYLATLDNTDPEVVHLRGILEIELHDALERDELELGRPFDCWCLGTGGREPIEVNGQTVWRVHCTCPEGQL